MKIKLSEKDKERIAREQRRAKLKEEKAKRRIALNTKRDEKNKNRRGGTSHLMR